MQTLPETLRKLTSSQRSIVAGLAGINARTVTRLMKGKRVKQCTIDRVSAALKEAGLAPSPAVPDFEIAPVPEVPHYVTDLYLCPAPGTQGWQVLLTTRVDGNARPVHYNFSPTIYTTPNAAAEAGLRMQSELEAQHERNRDPRLSPSEFLNQEGGAQ